MARHAESEATRRRIVNSDPARPMELTSHGMEQARCLGAQIAGIRVDLAVCTRLVRTRQTVETALFGRGVPVLVEPDLDEVHAGGLEGRPIEDYWAWKRGHAASERMPDGESLDDAMCRYARALRRLIARTESVTLVVTHEMALRCIAALGESSPTSTATIPTAVPLLFDEQALVRAANGLEALALAPARVPQTSSVLARAADASRVADCH